VGVGSNLGDPEVRVRGALADLAALGPLRASSLYRTEPLGDPRQPWYVNAVAEIETPLGAEALLARLRELEIRAGRPPERTRGGPRVLDLDLLLLGHLVVRTPTLELPHPGLSERRFVLEPLCELAPDAVDPRSGASAARLLAALDDPLRVEKLPAPDPGAPRRRRP
jgi:2-amino-4-hydroxy-6-hydroxymethyldihydropteridine diphosphokinase